MRRQHQAGGAGCLQRVYGGRLCRFIEHFDLHKVRRDKLGNIQQNGVESFFEIQAGRNLPAKIRDDLQDGRLRAGLIQTRGQLYTAHDHKHQWVRPGYLVGGCFHQPPTHRETFLSLDDEQVQQLLGRTGASNQALQVGRLAGVQTEPFARQTVHKLNPAAHLDDQDGFI